MAPPMTTSDELEAAQEELEEVAEQLDKVKHDAWAVRLKYIGIIAVAVPSIIAAWAGAFKSEDVAKEVAGEAAVHIQNLQKAVNQNNNSIDSIRLSLSKMEQVTKSEADSVRMLVIGFMVGQGSAKSGSRTHEQLSNNLKNLVTEIVKAKKSKATGSPVADRPKALKKSFPAPRQKVILTPPENLFKHSNKKGK